MSAKSDALDLMLRARDAWATGDREYSLELLDSARVRLEGSGYPPERLPVTFALMDRIRAAVLAEAGEG